MVNPIIRTHDFETVQGLTQMIGRSETVQSFSGAGFRDEALSVLAKYSDRPYARSVYPIVERLLFEDMELASDKSDDDLPFVDLPVNFTNPECDFEMSLRQRFGDVKNGVTANVQEAFRPYLSAVGTVAAVVEPQTVREWHPMFAQRIDAWAAWERGLVQSRSHLAARGRVPRSMRYRNPDGRR